MLPIEVRVEGRCTEPIILSWKAVLGIDVLPSRNVNARLELLANAPYQNEDTALGIVTEEILFN